MILEVVIHYEYARFTGKDTEAQSESSSDLLNSVAELSRISQSLKGRAPL